MFHFQSTNPLTNSSSRSTSTWGRKESTYQPPHYPKSRQPHRHPLLGSSKDGTLVARRSAKGYRPSRWGGSRLQTARLMRIILVPCWNDSGVMGHLTTRSLLWRQQFIISNQYVPTITIKQWRVDHHRVTVILEVSCLSMKTPLTNNSP